MLELYIGNMSNVVMHNDSWFNIHANRINFDDKAIQCIIQAIDGVKYLGDKHIQAKFDLNKGLFVGVDKLSTGCKTALNIYSFNNQIFTLGGCGQNAIDVIFRFKKGKCYMPYFMSPDRFNNILSLIINGHGITVNSQRELDNVLNSINIDYEDVIT